jgi:hypothetical protein
MHMYICRVVKNLDATVEKIKKTLPNVTDWDIQVTSNVTSHSLHLRAVVTSCFCITPHQISGQSIIIMNTDIDA